MIFLILLRLLEAEPICYLVKLCLSGVQVKTTLITALFQVLHSANQAGFVSLWGCSFSSLRLCRPKSMLQGLKWIRSLSFSSHHVLALPKGRAPQDMTVSFPWAQRERSPSDRVALVPWMSCGNTLAQIKEVDSRQSKQTFLWHFSPNQEGKKIIASETGTVQQTSTSTFCRWAMKLFALCINYLEKGWEKIRSIVCKWHQIFNLGKKKENTQMYNLLFIGSSYFPLEQADWQEQLTSGLAFWCVRGGAQAIWVTAHSGGKKYFCPSWMMKESKAWACLLPIDKIHHAMGWPGPRCGTGPSLAWRRAAVSLLRWWGLGSVLALVSWPRPSRAADMNDLNDGFTPGDAGLICRRDRGKKLDATAGRSQKTSSRCT